MSTWVAQRIGDTLSSRPVYASEAARTLTASTFAFDVRGLASSLAVGAIGFNGSLKVAAASFNILGPVELCI